MMCVGARIPAVLFFDDCLAVRLRVRQRVRYTERVWGWAEKTRRCASWRKGINRLWATRAVIVDKAEQNTVSTK